MTTGAVDEFQKAAFSFRRSAGFVGWKTESSEILVFPVISSRIVPDRYPIAVEEDTIHIDLHVMTDMDVFPVIHKERSRDPDMLSV